MRSRSAVLKTTPLFITWVLRNIFAWNSYSLKALQSYIPSNFMVVISLLLIGFILMDDVMDSLLNSNCFTVYLSILEKCQCTLYRFTQTNMDVDFWSASGVCGSFGQDTIFVQSVSPWSLERMENSLWWDDAVLMLSDQYVWLEPNLKSIEIRSVSCVFCAAEVVTLDKKSCCFSGRVRAPHLFSVPFSQSLNQFHNCLMQYCFNMLNILYIQYVAFVSVLQNTSILPDFTSPILF